MRGRIGSFEFTESFIPKVQVAYKIELISFESIYCRCFDDEFWFCAKRNWSSISKIFIFAKEMKMACFHVHLEKIPPTYVKILLVGTVALQRFSYGLF